MENLATVPLLIIDDLGMRKLSPTAAEELLEIVMRRYERTSTALTSNRPVDDWGKLLNPSPGAFRAVSGLLRYFSVFLLSSLPSCGSHRNQSSCRPVRARLRRSARRPRRRRTAAGPDRGRRRIARRRRRDRPLEGGGRTSHKSQAVNPRRVCGFEIWAEKNSSTAKAAFSPALSRIAGTCASRRSARPAARGPCCGIR